MINDTNLSGRGSYASNGRANQSIDTSNHKEQRLTVAANLCIIREMYKHINTGVPMSNFYKFLTGDLEASKQDIKKFENAFSRFITTGDGDPVKFSRILIAYGISEEYFIGTPMEADADITANFTDCFQYSDTTLMDSCRQALLGNLFSVKNMDGTLVIDCIRRMAMDMQGINMEESLASYAYAKYLSNLEPPAHGSTRHLSQKQLKRFYGKVGDALRAQEPPCLPEGKLDDTKIYTPKMDAWKIYDTLFLIREIYLLLASIDKLENPLEKFYAQLGIHAENYPVTPDSGQADFRKLFQAFEPYKFPASLFRGDSPSSLALCKEIWDAFSQYQNNAITLEQFRDSLNLELFYKVNVENAPTFMAIYSIYEKITHNP